MKVLVIGGAGFIGSHLVDKLVNLNYQVFVLDNLSTGNIENVNDQAKFYHVDIKNKNLIQIIFNNIKPDIVYHLAAQINVRKSINDPIDDAENNILGLLNVLQESVKHKVKKIIFSSSGGAIYKDNSEILKTENSEIGPASPYGISKLCGENYINFYKNIYGLDNTILRFSNVYGPRQNSKGEAGVISIFIDNALQNKDCVIYGDGNQTRDYIYVDDVINSLILSLNVSGTFNVSTGVETTVNYIAEQIKKHFSCEFTYASKIEGELYHNCLSSNLLQSYSWKPYIDIYNGVQKTIKYFRKE